MHKAEFGETTHGVASGIFKKSGQADTIFIALDQGGAATMGVKEAEEISSRVLGTPGHGVSRLIFVKNGKVILDRP